MRLERAIASGYEYKRPRMMTWIKFGPAPGVLTQEDLEAPDWMIRSSDRIPMLDCVKCKGFYTLPDVDHFFGRAKVIKCLCK